MVNYDLKYAKALTRALQLKSGEATYWYIRNNPNRTDTATVIRPDGLGLNGHNGTVHLKSTLRDLPSNYTYFSTGTFDRLYTKTTPTYLLEWLNNNSGGCNVDTSADWLRSNIENICHVNVDTSAIFNTVGFPSRYNSTAVKNLWLEIIADKRYRPYYSRSPIQTYPTYLNNLYQNDIQYIPQQHA